MATIEAEALISLKYTAGQCRFAVYPVNLSESQKDLVMCARVWSGQEGGSFEWECYRKGRELTPRTADAKSKQQNAPKDQSRWGHHIPGGFHVCWMGGGGTISLDPCP